MRRTLGALLLGLLGLALRAGAEEALVASPSGEEGFASVWSEGSLERGEGDGFSWLRLVSDGKGAPSFVRNLRLYDPPIDFTGKFIKVWVKLDDVSRLGSMEFRLSSDGFAASYFTFSFPWYADEEANVLQGGVWTPITIGFGAARITGSPDRSSIDSIGWYLADKGGEAPLTAYWGGLAQVDEPPEGVVSLSFDDGYDEHHWAAERMARHGFRGTAYIIPDAVGRKNYMSLQQLRDLRDRYGWEVSAHHQTAFTTFSQDQLESTILGIQRYLARNGFEKGAGHLAYPLGKQDPSRVRPQVRKHFRTARVAGAGPETLPPADPHLLRVLNVIDSTTPAELGAAARQAREHKEWLILMFHFLVEEPSNDTSYSRRDFERALQEIERAQVRVLPVGEVWEACGRATDKPCQFSSPASRSPGR